MNHRRNKSWTSQPAAEVLEDRAMLAGNVLVSFENGNLTLKGDNRANEISIEPSIAGVIVRGTQTTINGSSTPFALPSGQYTIAGNLKVEMKRGNDVVDLSVGVDGDVEAKMGSGRDVFATQSSDVIGNAFVNLGSSPKRTKGSRAQLFDSTFSAVIVKGAGGPHVVSLKGAAVGTVSASLGGGEDHLSIRDSTIGSLFGNGGGGRNDAFHNLDSSMIYHLYLKGFETT